MDRKKILSVGFCLFACFWAFSQTSLSRSSPNGSLVLSVDLNADGFLKYRVSYRALPVIGHSKMGFTLQSRRFAWIVSVSYLLILP
jgi:hypothetical protein